jgi:hypothetical protein
MAPPAGRPLHRSEILAMLSDEDDDDLGALTASDDDDDDGPEEDDNALSDIVEVRNEHGEIVVLDSAPLVPNDGERGTLTPPPGTPPLPGMMFPEELPSPGSQEEYRYLYLNSVFSTFIPYIRNHFLTSGSRLFAVRYADPSGDPLLSPKERGKTLYPVISTFFKICTYNMV